MLFRGYNSEFCKQNFTDKSEHDKCVLQRNLRKDFTACIERKRIKRI